MFCGVFLVADTTYASSFSIYKRFNYLDLDSQFNRENVRTIMGGISGSDDLNTKVWWIKWYN